MFEEFKEKIQRASLLNAAGLIKEIREAYQAGEITDEEREQLIALGKEKAGGIDLSKFGL